jgi:hypothetical protein
MKMQVLAFSLLFSQFTQHLPLNSRLRLTSRMVLSAAWEFFSFSAASSIRNVRLFRPAVWPTSASPWAYLLNLLCFDQGLRQTALFVTMETRHACALL